MKLFIGGVVILSTFLLSALIPPSVTRERNQEIRMSILSRFFWKETMTELELIRLVATHKGIDDTRGRRRIRRILHRLISWGFVDMCATASTSGRRLVTLRISNSGRNKLSRNNPYYF